MFINKMSELESIKSIGDKKMDNIDYLLWLKNISNKDLEGKITL